LEDTPGLRRRFYASVLFLQGRSEQKGLTHVHTWEGKIFLFEDVPADVCQQCGEIYFSPDILEVMDKIVTSNMEPKTTVAVPVFSISDAVQ